MTNTPQWLLDVIDIVDEVDIFEAVDNIEDLLDILYDRIANACDKVQEETQ